MLGRHRGAYVTSPKNTLRFLEARGTESLVSSLGWQHSVCLVTTRCPGTECTR